MKTNAFIVQQINFVVLLFMLLYPLHAESAKAKNNYTDSSCNPEYALRVISSINDETLHDSLIIAFLESIDPACFQDNAEYSEIYHQALFLMLSEYTENTVLAITKTSTQLNTVLTMLENPLDDKINLDELHERISKLAFNKKTKKKILSSLKKARSKY
jgi:hypothetical protein